MANSLYKLVLLFVHVLIDVYANVSRIFATNVRFFLELLKNEETLDFDTDSKSLLKCPNHLGIVLTEMNFSIEDVSSILVWSLGLGIPFISIYDLDGLLKVKKKELLIGVDQKCAQYRQINKLRIQTSADVNFNKSAAKESESRVVLLGSSECCADVVKTTKHVAQLIKLNQMKYSDVTTSQVDALLQEHWGFPDPDLILKYGQTESLFGYLPWQTRLSEILSLPTVKDIKYQTFLRTLQIYARTQQRFGK